MYNFIKLIFLFLYICLSQSTAFSFYAKYLEDPASFCKKNNKTQISSRECLVNRQLSKRNGIDSFIRLLNGDHVIAYTDILKASKRSLKIIKEAKYKKTYFLKIKSSLSKRKKLFENKKIKMINEKMQILSSLEYEIMLKKMKKSRCFMSEKDFCKFKEKRYQHKILDPLLLKKARLVANMPILTSESLREFRQEKIQARYDKYSSKINERHTCLQNKKIKDFFSTKKQRACSSKRIIQQARRYDNEFNYSPNDVIKYLKEPVNTAIATTIKLGQKHEKIVSEVNTLFNEKPKKRSLSFKYRLEGMKKRIFNDPEITTDYFTTMNENEFDRSHNSADSASCRLIKHHKINMENENINSIGVNLATLVIPAGGAFAFAVLAKRIGTLSKVGDLRKTLYAELGVMSADTLNLKKDFKRCEDLKKRFIALELIPKRLESEFDECEKQLHTLEMSYITAILGGAIQVIPLAKVLKKNKLKRKEIRDRLLKNKHGSKVLKSRTKGRFNRTNLARFEQEREDVANDFVELAEYLKTLPPGRNIPPEVLIEEKIINMRLVKLLENHGIKSKIVKLPKTDDFPYEHLGVEVISGNKDTLLGTVSSHQKKYLNKDQKITFDPTALIYEGSAGGMNSLTGLKLGDELILELGDSYNSSLLHEIHHAKTMLRNEQKSDNLWSLNISKDMDNVNTKGLVDEGIYANFFSVDEIPAYMKESKQKMSKYKKAQKIFNDQGREGFKGKPELLKDYLAKEEISDSLDMLDKFSDSVEESIFGALGDNTHFYHTMNPENSSVDVYIGIIDSSGELERTVSINIKNITEDNAQLIKDKSYDHLEAVYKKVVKYKKRAIDAKKELHAH